MAGTGSFLCGSFWRENGFYPTRLSSTRIGIYLRKQGNTQQGRNFRDSSLFFSSKHKRCSKLGWGAVVYFNFCLHIDASKARNIHNVIFVSFFAHLEVLYEDSTRQYIVYLSNSLLLHRIGLHIRCSKNKD